MSEDYEEWTEEDFKNFQGMTPEDFFEWHEHEQKNGPRDTIYKGWGELLQHWYAWCETHQFEPITNFREQTRLYVAAEDQAGKRAGDIVIGNIPADELKNLSQEEKQELFWKLHEETEQQIREVLQEWGYITLFRHFDTTVNPKTLEPEQQHLLKKPAQRNVPVYKKAIYRRPDNDQTSWKDFYDYYVNLLTKAERVETQAKPLFESEIHTPSNPIVMQGFRGIWNGGPTWSTKKFWTFDRDGITAEAHHHPRSGGRITVTVDPRDTDSVWTIEKVDEYLQNLSPFTSDVALAVLASLSRAQSPMLEPVIISAEDIRKLKGVELYGAKRSEFDQRIADEMKSLQHLRFNVMQVKAQLPGDGKNKKWSGQSWSNDRLFDIVAIEDWQDDLFGGKERVGVKWSVRAGQWAYYFLNNDARRWVTTMAAALFTLSHRNDRRAEQIAKKIGHFIAFNGWREGKGQPLRWSRQKILENIGESVEAETKPPRLIAALDEALELLVEHKIVSRIELGPCDVDKQNRGWVKRYLQSEVEFISNEQVVNSNQLSTSSDKKPIKSKTKKTLSSLNRSKLRQTREARDLNQEAAARDLGISRVYYSGIESGRRDPSDELLAKINNWMM